MITDITTITTDTAVATTILGTIITTTITTMNTVITTISRELSANWEEWERIVLNIYCKIQNNGELNRFSSSS